MRAHRLRLVGAVAAFVLASCLTQGARAAREVWSLLPDETLAFVVVNNPAKVSEDVEALGKLIEAPLPSFIAALEEKEPVVAHLDASRPTAVVLLRRMNQFSLLGLVPVRDFQAFVKAGGGQNANADVNNMKLGGKEMVAASKGGYALIARAGKAGLINAALDNSGQTARELAPLRAEMDRGDVAGAATRRGIQTAMGLARDILTAQSKKMRAALQEDPQSDQAEFVAGAFDFYKLLVGGIEKNVKSYGFVVDLNEQGVVGRDTIILKEGPLSSHLADAAPIEVDWANSLPAGQPILMFAGVTPPSLGDEMLEFSADIMVAMKGIYGMDREAVDKMVELSRPMIKDIRGMAFMLGLPEDPNAPLYAVSGGFIKVQGNAPAFANSYIELTEKMAEALEDSDKSFMKFEKAEKIRVDGRPGVKLSMVFDFQRMGGDATKAMMDTMMKRMYGADGKLAVYFAAIDDQTLVFGYTSQDTMEHFAQAMDPEAFGQHFSNDPAYAKLLVQLPEDTLWMGVVDVSGYMKMVGRLVGSMGGPQLPEFGPATPIGMGVCVEGNQCDATWIVPLSTIKNVVQGIRNLRTQGAAAPPAQREN